MLTIDQITTFILSHVYIGKAWHDNAHDIVCDTALSLLALATLGVATYK